MWALNQNGISFPISLIMRLMNDSGIDLCHMVLSFCYPNKNTTTRTMTNLSNILSLYYWAKTAAAGEMNPIVWRNIFPTFYLFTEPVKEWKSARFPSPFLQNLLLQALARREWTWSFFLWNSTQTIPLSYIMPVKNICFSKERKSPWGSRHFCDMKYHFTKRATGTPGDVFDPLNNLDVGRLICWWMGDRLRDGWMVG